MLCSLILFCPFENSAVILIDLQVLGLNYVVHFL